jgi:catechol 2,3-dioxygenase-like lactoylglutathione lyase family enzyme
MSENIIQITPVMNVADVAPAVAFFTDVLGFRCVIHARDYAYVEREGAGLRILAHDDPAELGRPHGGFAYYLDVRDLAAVVEELGPRLASLPAADVYGPVDQPYGQRELLIRAPDGNLVVFGQAIRSGSGEPAPH